jgi:YVTN family beta-propeller protein
MPIEILLNSGGRGGGVGAATRPAPDGSTVYVTNVIDGTVSVIATATNTVTATIPVGSGPRGVAVTPDGSTVYVANFANTVSVIDTTSNTVTATIPGFSRPIAFGVFKGPPPVLATPPSVLATPPSGTACNGCSTAPGDYPPRPRR